MGKIRILIVDDNTAIHIAFADILGPKKESGSGPLDDLMDSIFGDETPDVAKAPPEEAVEYILESAYQGDEAVDMVRKSIREEFCYSLIFMDVRMPPGIDGLETIQKIWEVDRLLH